MGRSFGLRVLLLPGRGCRFADFAKEGPRRDRIALLSGDGGKNACAGSIDFERDLLGLDLDNGLVGLDCLALFLEPASDRRLGDRFA